MQFPLSLFDITLWLAITAVILLATSELISPFYGKTSLLIDKERLRLAAIGVGITFIVSILAQIFLMAPFQT